MRRLVRANIAECERVRYNRRGVLHYRARVYRVSISRNARYALFAPFRYLNSEYFFRRLYTPNRNYFLVDEPLTLSLCFAKSCYITTSAERSINARARTFVIHENQPLAMIYPGYTCAECPLAPYGYDFFRGRRVIWRERSALVNSLGLYPGGYVCEARA